MINLRKSAARGHANHGWLESYHSFSFAEYYDPAHMGYSVLRVINDDYIAPAAGFGMHPHRDMEIITYMLDGALRHQDSLGNGAVIRGGDVQYMSAGTGVRHSEFNASSEHPAHLLQIWILPARNGLPASYEDKTIPRERKLNRWCVVASAAGGEHVLKTHQDIILNATVLEAEQALSYPFAENRCAYLHVASGSIKLNGVLLETGDAAMIEQEASIEVVAETLSELLLFDLPLNS
jgi:quercetin 2,3-dioxygenase